MTGTESPAPSRLTAEEDFPVDRAVMDKDLYPRVAAIEELHWWYVARRAIASHMIEGLSLPPGAEILEVGCGTGGNLGMLAHHGRVYAMEANERARAFAAARGHAEVRSGRLPEDIPFADKSFDLIVLLDVLEHVDADTAALNVLRGRLKHDGWLLLTVPAYPFLWSRLDEFSHHKRRYLMSDLQTVARRAGYAVRYVSYFNFWMFPSIGFVRLVQRFTGGALGDELVIPPRLINQLLTSVFASERHLIGRISLPFGLSLILLAQRAES